MINSDWLIILIFYFPILIFTIYAIIIEIKNNNYDAKNKYFKTRLSRNRMKNKNWRQPDNWRIMHVFDINANENDYEIITQTSCFPNAACFILNVKEEYILTQRTAFFIWYLLFCINLTYILLLLIGLFYNDSAIMTKCPKNYGIISNKFGNDNDYENGNCFITLEIPYVEWTSVIFLFSCVSISYFDMTKKAKNDLKNAKFVITNHFNTTINNDNNDNNNNNNNKYQLDYYEKFNQRGKFTWYSKLKNKKKAMITASIGLIVMILWLHLIFFELIDDENWHYLSRVKKKKRKVVYFLYTITVILFCLQTYGILYVTFKTYNIYLDFYYISKLLLNPIRIDTINELQRWWLIRRFYFQFVMPIYFRFGNGVYSSLMVLVVAFAIYITRWIFVPTNKSFQSLVEYPATIIQFFVVVMVILCTYTFTYTILSIQKKQERHQKMLLMEKTRLLNSQYFNPQNNKIDIIVRSIDTVIECISKYDFHAKAMGIYVTKKKMYAFLFYLVSAILTIMVKNSLN
eukprot:456654_1